MPPINQFNCKDSDLPSQAANRKWQDAMLDGIAARIAWMVWLMRDRFVKKQLVDPKPRLGKAPVYVMRANHAKLADVALCLLHEAERLGMTVTQYQLVKAVFFADREHINRYGRPITWDRYVAMRHGPVPMAFYNMLMENEKVLAKTGAPQWSWRPTGDEDRREFFGPKRPINLKDALTASDVKQLCAGLLKVKVLGISGVWKETHEDPAYVDAWEENDEGRSFSMSLELFFDKPDCEEALMLSRYSQLMH